MKLFEHEKNLRTMSDMHLERLAETVQKMYFSRGCNQKTYQKTLYYKIKNNRLSESEKRKIKINNDELKQCSKYSQKIREEALRRGLVHD